MILQMSLGYLFFLTSFTLSYFLLSHLGQYISVHLYTFSIITIIIYTFDSQFHAASGLLVPLRIIIILRF